MNTSESMLNEYYLAHLQQLNSIAMSVDELKNDAELVVVKEADEPARIVRGALSSNDFNQSDYSSLNISLEQAQKLADASNRETVTRALREFGLLRERTSIYYLRGQLGRVGIEAFLAADFAYQEVSYEKAENYLIFPGYDLKASINKLERIEGSGTATSYRVELIECKAIESLSLTFIDDHIVEATNDLRPSDEDIVLWALVLGDSVQDIYRFIHGHFAKESELDDVLNHARRKLETLFNNETVSEVLTDIRQYWLANKLKLELGPHFSLPTQEKLDEWEHRLNSLQ